MLLYCISGCSFHSIPFIKSLFFTRTCTYSQMLLSLSLSPSLLRSIRQYTFSSNPIASFCCLFPIHQARLLRDAPAMLHFLYNEDLVGVFVAHDIAQGSWVLQLPFFPPHQSPADFPPEKCLDLVLKGNTQDTRRSFTPVLCRSQM